MNSLNKPWKDQTDDELVASYDYWSERVRTASGWSSAYEAAKCLKHTCREAQARGLSLINSFPIVKG